MKIQKTFGLGSEAPDFTAESTQGIIHFHEWKRSKWTILFSFPGAFTPVCTTDIGALADLSPILKQKQILVLGLSCSSTEEHENWVCDVNSIMRCRVDFPIISDTKRLIAQPYNMLDFQEPTNVDKQGLPHTHRSCYVIDPSNIIRAMVVYPLSTGRNFDEIVRVVDALVLYDMKKLATGSKWKVGDDVFLLPSTNDEEAKRKFKGFKKTKDYYRTVKSPEATPTQASNGE